MNIWAAAVCIIKGTAKRVAKRIAKLTFNERGSVMVETVIILPILVFLTFAIIQIGALLFMLNSLNHITYEAARFMSVGQLDDEGNGQFLDCSSLAGVSSDGRPSAESVMCGHIGVIPGTFSVSASDGVVAGSGQQGALITTHLKVLSSSVLFFDPTSAFESINVLQATAMQMREPLFVGSPDSGDEHDDEHD